MNRNTPVRGLCAALALLLGSAANAVVIEYTTSFIAGDTWEYEYTITNDMALTVDEFSIFFDVGDYADLVVTGSHADWDALVLQPDAALPDDGVYDALALVAGLTTGESASGFSVQFSYLLGGTPGDQAFDIVDPDTFAVLFSGRTVSRPIPAPMPLALIALGLGLIGVMASRGGR